MESAGLSGKTADGGINERTYHVLRFDADSIALCSYTLTTEQKKEQYQGSLTYNDWQYFKWHKKENRLLIAGLPLTYSAWSTLQVQAHTLTGINNKTVVFEKVKQSVIATAISGKIYAAPIGDSSYLVFTFDKDSVELFYAKNIAPKGAPLLARDETKAFKKYKWMAFLHLRAMKLKKAVPVDLGGERIAICKPVPNTDHFSHVHGHLQIVINEKVVPSMGYSFPLLIRLSQMEEASKNGAIKSFHFLI